MDPVELGPVDRVLVMLARHRRTSDEDAWLRDAAARLTPGQLRDLAAKVNLNDVAPQVLLSEERSGLRLAVADVIRQAWEARRDLYYEVFVHEQHDIVDPGILQAAADCGSPAVVALLKRVRPRFAYFPRRERLRFTDFTSVDQRNREGLRALEWAEEVGPERVLQAMAEY